ncbi:glycosyltransferase family 2 protein, partial [Parapedobacter sp. 10938]|uniref:glycosyltransferase family 2 protein n=1 Tax=Parapedobacter flavus TaxID=3110225 RepID=UPI002DBA0CE0
MKLTVIVPCHNEEGNIHPFLSRTENAVKEYDYRIIFVDDGSTDGTLNVLKTLSATHPRINYLSLSRNFGQQMALKAGYDHALYADCVVCMDADLQHPPEAIPAMVDKWAEGYEVVCGVRREPERGATSFWNRLASRLFYRLINRFA